jgi:3-dehydroquinate synthase
MKNLIGDFYPPSDVFIDAAFLASLTVEDIKSGIGEILHYYVYGASPLLDELIRDYGLFLRDRSFLDKHVRESLKIKQSVIEADEFDRGERNKFNYGHTFGHALESVTDYAIKHGQAVTVGMDLANYVSLSMGIMNPETFNDLHSKLSVNFPEYDWGGIDLGRYFALLSKDKKNVGSNVGCILAKEAGVLFKRQLPADDHFKETIRAYFSGRGLRNLAD